MMNYNNKLDVSQKSGLSWQISILLLLLIQAVVQVPKLVGQEIPSSSVTALAISFTTGMLLTIGQANALICSMQLLIGPRLTRSLAARVAALSLLARLSCLAGSISAALTVVSARPANCSYGSGADAGAGWCCSILAGASTMLTIAARDTDGEILVNSEISGIDATVLFQVSAIEPTNANRTEPKLTCKALFTTRQPVTGINRPCHTITRLKHLQGAECLAGLLSKEIEIVCIMSASYLYFTVDLSVIGY